MNTKKEKAEWSVNYSQQGKNKKHGTVVLSADRLIFFPSDNNLTEQMELTKEEISSVQVHSRWFYKSVTISVRGRNHSFSGFFFNPVKVLQFIKS